MAKVQERLEGGRGISLLSAVPPELDQVGYVEAEYLVVGTACRYQASGPTGADGRWAVEPARPADDDQPSDQPAQAEFATRVVVRRPEVGSDGNGTVVVEWLNVSAGADGPPDWTYLRDELVRTGATWVGVSAQRVGVMGGDGLDGLPEGFGGGLVGTDPERYGALSHPGDAYAYDLFTQVGRVLRSPGDLDPLAGLAVERVLAVGESQSAFQLTTYANAIAPRDRVYDGFLIHSRGAGGGRLDGARVAPAIQEPVRVRDDLDVPVLIVQMETDLGAHLRYGLARQPDAERVRVWEVAGTAHADEYQIGGMSDLFGFAEPPNDGPQHLVVKAALRHLDRWVAEGVVPPVAPRLVLVDGRVLRDGLGNALGGIRTPVVDVPVAVVSGDNEADTLFHQLFGRRVAFSVEALRQLYPTQAAYLAAFAQSATDAVAAGWVLPEDEPALLAMARPEQLADAGIPPA